ncbi:hypothetical protein BDF20DRAFT_839221 [Mycotypha africana]|uniref:uncharacterized protein n=1 Tax=Mycotypha africana TaxID=64632 RepID=UPI002301919D|nr:uncharacterized protein BDF20DRAFT_839221 [Mycotypha africana]KAI8969285.1 hypothetical protein BDF20DRAFT_839221 [Mycotypha africana]
MLSSLKPFHTRPLQQLRSLSSKGAPIAKTTTAFKTNNSGSSSSSSNSPPEKKEKSLPWRPVKRVSRMTMDKIRTLATTQPEYYKIETLSDEFKISCEAVKRILKSKWAPTQEELERQERKRYAAMGRRKEEIKKGTYARFNTESTPSTP